MELYRQFDGGQHGESRVVEVLQATPWSRHATLYGVRNRIPHGHLQSLPHTCSGPPATSNRCVPDGDRVCVVQPNQVMKAWLMLAFTEWTAVAYIVNN